MFAHPSFLIARYFCVRYTFSIKVALDELNRDHRSGQIRITTHQTTFRELKSDSKTLSSIFDFSQFLSFVWSRILIQLMLKRAPINPPAQFASNPTRLSSLSVSSSVNHAVRWLISFKTDGFANRLTKLFKMIQHSLASSLTILLVQAHPQGGDKSISRAFF